jgi:hypothetical protein
MEQRVLKTRVVRAGEKLPAPPMWEESTPESRMSAVWDLADVDWLEKLGNREG